MKIRLALMILLTFGTASQMPVPVQAARLAVVASVFPLYDFAREVAGPGNDVGQLLPPGVEPHTWDPTPGDILQMRRSDLFIYIGKEMEPWAAKVLRAADHEGLTTLGVLAALDLPAGDGAQGTDRDPHIWLDLTLAARTVRAIGDAMAQADKAGSELYTANARDYALTLESLDREYADRLKTCSSRTLVTGGHAAFGHLARRYNLEQVPIYGLSPDAEPGPRELGRITRIVQEQGIKTIFFEELVNPRLAQVLARETGASLRVLDPGANISNARWTGNTTFLDIVRQNLESLAEGLGCE